MALLVMLASLGVQTAAAFDLHGNGDGPSGSTFIVNVDEHGDHVDGCDHCCHLGAHFTGLPSNGWALPGRVRGSVTVPHPHVAPHAPPAEIERPPTVL